MIVKIAEDSTKTGRLRFRSTRRGKLILQMEVCYLDKDGDEYLAWIDASLTDITVYSND